MTNRLPDDIARCHDSECPERERCLRWIERSVGGDWSRHAWSLRVNYDEACKHQIEPEKEKA